MGADLGLHLGHTTPSVWPSQGLTGSAFHMSGWLPFGAVEHRVGDLDAEFEGPMRFPLADAFDLGRVQRINLLAALFLALIPHPPGERKRMRKNALQFRVAPRTPSPAPNINAQLKLRQSDFGCSLAIRMENRYIQQDSKSGISLRRRI